MPASLREVTPTSSMRGWRQPICAASAPVKPEAPATRTLAFSLTEATPDCSQLGRDPLAPCRDLIVGEIPIDGAELEPQGNALATLTKLLPFVEIEQLGGAQQLAATAENRIPHLGRRDIVRHNHRQVLEHRREGRHILESLFTGRGRPDQCRETDLESDSFLQVPGATNERIQLSDPATLRPIDQNGGGATGVQKRLRPRLEGEHHTESRGETF